MSMLGWGFVIFCIMVGIGMYACCAVAGKEDERMGIK